MLTTDPSTNAAQVTGAVDIAAVERPLLAQTIAREVIDWNLPGFLSKARVGTAFGDLPIEFLRVRDDIRTLSGSLALVKWVDKVHLDEDFLRKHPSALPVRIPANAFGPRKPSQDLVVSPRQEVCPDAHVASGFLQASHLCSRFGAHPLLPAGLTYYRFHCGEPVVIRVDGVWVRILP